MQATRVGKVTENATECLEHQKQSVMMNKPENTVNISLQRYYG